MQAYKKNARARTAPGLDIPTLSIMVTASLLSSALVLLLAGCATESEVQAESREIRLTEGDGVKFIPRFSPDGRTLVYTRNSGLEDFLTTFAVPAMGGEPRRVSQENVSEIAVGWHPDGNALFSFSVTDMEVRMIDLQGRSLQKLYREEGNAQVAAVSADGETFLWRIWNGDNYDMGLRDIHGTQALELLGATPGFEYAGCFGPKLDEITVVYKNGLSTDNTGIKVWSRATGEYSDLPLPKAENRDPCWSPDRTKLAFSSNQSGSQDIWVLDAATKRVVQVTSGPEDETTPDWSPDGEWLAFSRRNKVSHIFVGDPESFESSQITEGEARDEHPRPSPDGKWVLFVRRDPVINSSPSKRYLCLVPAEGGEVRRLDLGSLKPKLAAAYYFTWSPDSREIAFTADDGSGNLDLYRMPIGGGKPVRVTIAPGPDLIPTWSEDGRTLAYSRPAEGETQIWTIPATGGLAKQVTFHKQPAFMAIWSPDSKRLAYFTESDKGYEVWTTDLGNLERRVRITDGDEMCYPVAWSEDGREVVTMLKHENDYTLWAIQYDGIMEKRTKLGKIGTEKDGTSNFFVLNERGKEYVGQVYPGGVHAFSDGYDVADIFSIHVSELLAAELESAEGLR